MVEYYAVDRDKLQTDLKDRSDISKEIREKTDAWAEEEYGIFEFSALVAKHLGNPSGTETIVARHIPSVKIEDIMYYLGSKALGYKPASLSFLRDKFCSNNWSKLACVKMPWLVQGKNGLSPSEMLNHFITDVRPGDIALATIQGYWLSRPVV